MVALGAYIGQTMFTFQLLEQAQIPWQEMDRFEDRVVFQTRAWLNFVAETQNGTPVVAKIFNGSDFAGYFSGVVTRKMGIRILGSSFPGWTTPYIAFNLLPGVSRAAVLPALEQWAFRELGCMHVEVSDFHFLLEDGADLGAEHTFYRTYVTDLTKTEDELFKAMNSACRRCIRKAEKSGVVIEEAAGHPGFADEYYAQLKDVFAKQGKVPGYSLERVRALIRHLHPTGNLLLLRARDPNGLCIGTGIYPGFNRIAEFWGNASWREHQHWRPNESLHWYAMRYWKNRGIQIFDWGGGGSYKEKYGVTPLNVPWFYKSKYKILSTMRDQARDLFYKGQRIAGRFSTNPTPVAAAE